MPATYGVETLLPPPPGYSVNFAHPRRRGDVEVYWAAGVGNVLMLFFVGQRLYTKIAFAKGLRLDDGFLTFAWLTSITVQALNVFSYASGISGVHAWEIPLMKYQASQMATYITALFYVFCAAIAKLSLSVSYLRLSPSKWYRRSVWATMAILVVYSFIVICCMVFSCSPISKAWRPNVDGACLDRSALYMAAAVMNTLTDIMLLLLTIPMLYGLYMQVKRRLDVAGIFAVGLLTVITSVVQCAYLPEWLNSEDQTWAIAPSNLWASVEVNLFVICPSMLTLYEFFHELKERRAGTRRRGSVESLPTMSSTASILTLTSTNIVMIDGGGSKERRENRDQQRKKKTLRFFGTTAAANVSHDGDGAGGNEQQKRQFDSSALRGLKSGNGSQVSIGLGDETDRRVQQSASTLSVMGEGESENGILMTKTVTVMHEKGP